jgi:tape measure domain-containing protein
MADEVLVTEFRLSDKMSGGLAKLDARMKSFLGSTSIAGAKIPGLGQAIAGVGVAAGVAAAAVLGFGNAASIAAGDYEALVKGLEAYAGGAENLKYQLEVLKKISAAPGLGFEEAIRGAVRLQAAGLGFETAANAISQFGNALALVGGGKAELDGVLLALTQIAAKGKISAEELLQIQERVPQIRGVVQSQFGTSDTEQLQKMGITSQQFISAIIKGLRELPRAGGSAKNEREVIDDELRILFVQIGTEINTALIPTLKAFSTELSALSSSGVLSQITQSFLALGPASLEMNTVTEELIYSLAELPNRLKKFGEGLAAVGDFFTNQFKNSYWGKIADVVSRIASGGQVGFSQAFDETYNTGAGQEAVNRLREARSKLATQPELQRKEETEKIIAPMVTTANNTAKLVELQQKQVDLSTQMLGGGTTAANAASPVRLGQAMSGRSGGGRGNVNYHIEQVVRAIMEQTMGMDIAAVRNSGTPNRLGVR